MEQIKKTKHIYAGIDICKLFAAIMVVLLHSVETTNIYAVGVQYVATRFAVPFFFIASGFFFHAGLISAEDERGYFFKYEKKLLVLFAVWAIVFFAPFTVVEYIQKYPDASAIKLLLLLVRRILWIGPGPYWYLISLMLSIAFIYLCHKKRANILLIVVMVIGISLEIAYTCFRGVLSEIPLLRYILNLIYIVFSWENNFLMYGIPFTGLGYFIYQKGLYIPPKISLVVFFSATGIRIVEYLLPSLIPNETFWESNCISIAFIIQAISLFLFAKEWKPNISREKSIFIRRLSSFIYFSHAIILYNILDNVLKKFTAWKIYSAAMVFPKWVFVLTVCYILFRIIVKVNNKHLNYLINA